MAAAPAPVRVGIGGWTYPPWRGSFYPEGLPQSRELAHASGLLGAIEINATFHGTQKPASFAKWRAQTPDGFVFSVKANRFTTYRRVLAEAGESVERFLGSGLAELGDKLGPILWQLPTGKRFEPDDLAVFLALLPASLAGRPLRHALEVRDASFACADYLALARRHGVATVFTDSTEHPSLADLTGDFVYARLMRARPRLKAGYGPKEIADWAATAKRWSAGEDPPELPHAGAPSRRRGKPREVFVFFIDGAKERAPLAAVATIAALRRA